MVAKGKATAKGKNQVVKVAKGQYVELAFEGEDQILTFLGQFGNTPATATHGDRRTVSTTPATAGPLHNQIPQPEPRASTTRRSGRRTSARPTTRTCSSTRASEPVDGELVPRAVVGPLQRRRLRQRLGPGPEQRGRIRQQLLRRHRLHARHRAVHGRPGRPPGATADRQRQDRRRRSTPSWRTFDVWDRYDYDGDSNFDEPDGYIDHFQSVHAGEGEETGGGAQGTDAIWSHRSYANSPGFRLRRARRSAAWPFGGLPIGSSSKWIGDYTDRAGERRRRRLRARVRPRPRSAGRVRHQRQHRRRREQHRLVDPVVAGLVRHGRPTTCGSVPGRHDHLGAVVLGWLDNDVVAAGASTQRSSSARPSTTPSRPRRLVVLPDKSTSNVGDPQPGVGTFYYSGQGQQPRHHDDQDRSPSATGRHADRSRPSTTSRKAWTTRTSRYRPTVGANVVNIHRARAPTDANGRLGRDRVVGPDRDDLSARTSVAGHQQHLAPTPTDGGVQVPLLDGRRRRRPGLRGR